MEVRRTGRLSRSGLDLVGDFAFGPGGNAGRFRFPANSSARLDSGRRLVGPDAVAKAAAVADQRDIGVVTKFTVTLRAGIGTSLLTLVRLLSGLKTLRDFPPSRLEPNRYQLTTGGPLDLTTIRIGSLYFAKLRALSWYQSP